MKALFFDKVLMLEELEKPNPGPEEVLIRVSKAGICNTEISRKYTFRPEHFLLSLPGFSSFRRG